MPRKLLLTSFQTWLPHQISNSSDDLLENISQHESFAHSLSYLRQLPVDILQASSRVIAKIENLRPDSILLCGMAEKRTQLTVESCATCRDALLKTSVDLNQLMAGLAATEISDNAGKFVCEGLYYQVLKHLQGRNFKMNCIFVHVPQLTLENSDSVVADFNLLINKLALLGFRF
ncbi:MAG: peptidase C15 [Symploca sp. SIO1A3]|nr:peptidase C15 [Symploca sp. SIO1A3]